MYCPGSLSEELAGRCGRLMSLQEAAYAVDRAGFQFGRVLPGINRDVRVRCQRCDIDGHLVCMRLSVVRQDKHRCLAGTHEVARYAVNEGWPGAVKVAQIVVDGVHRHSGPFGSELFGPDITSGIVHHVRFLRTVADRLAQHPCDDAIRGTLHQLEGKRAADAVAEEEELADAEVIHQPQLVVGESVPRL